MRPDGPALRWFQAAIGAPTPVQARAWALLAAPARPHALLVAPTGSGKTLAAFLAAIDRLVHLDAPEAAVRVLYVSPLKALVHDVHKNLQVPLAGIAGPRRVEVDLRTGDTPERDRRRQARKPADILVTTPESLYLLLGSRARETLRAVELVIVDEIHALVDTKRGVHLALSLERLEELAPGFQRVGLSATVRPLEEVAGFLAGGRPVEIVDTHRPPRLDLRVETLLADGSAPAAPASFPPAAPASFPLDNRTGWPRVHERVLELVRAHRTTLVFVNSRRLCERMAQRLNELAGEELVRAHHGSVAREQRLEIEAALKEGRLRGLVATSTLELGIDMGSIDHVVLVESPGSVARGLQRVGRAGHQVGGTSEATIFPRFRADLVECAVLARGMLEGRLEALRAPRNCLDVLAQQLVAMGDRVRGVDDAYALVRRAWPYRSLPRPAFDATLEMLAGRWLSGPLADLTPRLVWDRVRDEVHARPAALTVARLNAGSIPDRGAFGVFLGKGGPRVGELDEEMVFERTRGETFLLGATTWRIEEITRDQVIVSPAPGLGGQMPFWRSEWDGRPVEVGRAIGAFVRTIEADPDPVATLVAHHAFEPDGARALLDVLAEQRRATGALPTDRCIVLERYPEESGDTRVAILSPFGARAHAAWAVAIEAAAGRHLGTPVKTEHGEDGIMLRLAAGVELPRDLLLPRSEDIEDLLVERLADYPVFAARFRENAGRALLLPRQRPGRRTPLWQQRIRAQNLLATVRAWPDFPILLETWRECLEDLFDLPGLAEVLDGVHQGTVAVHEVETRAPSPFARSLAYRWVSTWMYELDGPAAERRAQALALDRGLLDTLVGRPSWHELLDEATIVAVEAELQALAPGWQARDADQLHDVLRRVGDLGDHELRVRNEGPPDTAELVATGRAVRVGWAGGRWIATEDAALYAALGVGDVPPAPDAFRTLVQRYARTHGPFTTREVADRWGLPEGVVSPVLEQLAAEGALLPGTYRAGGRGWCEPGVLRRLKRRALEHARGEVVAATPQRYAAFLPRWQLRPGRSLLDVIVHLEGMPLPFSDLEGEILPARVPGYRPAMLDELGALGQVAWIGHAPLEGDGRVALYRRDQLPAWVDPPGEPPPDPLAREVLATLTERGATFLVELQGLHGRDDRAALLDALWSLVWAGLVTNDTFQPLRARAERSRAGPAGMARAAPGGRWSLVHRLARPAAPTVQAHARAEALLRRYGIVAPGAARLERLPGGGAAVYPVLRALEEAGKVRRGMFVEGGAQFAVPEAVELLRRDEPQVVVLAATDPANAWGALVDWPFPGARRVAGARVVLGNGALLVYVEGRSLTLGEAPRADIVAALTALRGHVLRSADRDLRIERVNGAAAAGGAALLEAGFQRDPGGRGYTCGW